MKAPDKIYIEQKAVMYDIVNTEPCKPDDYEYIYKDALLEWLNKAKTAANNDGIRAGFQIVIKHIESL